MFRFMYSVLKAFENCRDNFDNISRNLSFQQLVFGGEKVKVKYNNFDEEIVTQQQQPYGDPNYPNYQNQ